jgi:hypothetical protein
MVGYLIRNMWRFTKNVYLCRTGDIVLLWLFPRTYWAEFFKSQMFSVAMYGTYRSAAGSSIWNNKQTLFDFTYVIALIV